MNKYWTLGLSVMAYFIIGLLTTFVIENIDDKEWAHASLYDVVHENFPPYPSYWVTDIFAYFFIIYTLFRWGAINIQYVSLYILSLAIILLLRLFTFTLTQTPPPIKINSAYRKEVCKKKILSHIGFFFPKAMNISCVDNMFSSHTAHIMAALTLIFLFSKSVAEKLILTLVSFACVFSITSSRLHYTSDVIVASIVAPLVVFAVYKTWFKNM